ncbi:unnamed protein product [Vitrella brassicaformis CCMP3155]|uniref:Uncharacterized protein n=1 Tax=Vitrella brassicaformis (strain CCMP3155) TaxID=1169540 RepID=A0A0G4H1B3_VITBC|nr:unnamed protein product [Vitrella brassicaformis CCMP3155]|eukprot:CEM37369.1 unnamed protein product [Vitrella brassicaformis CCMP3155]
MAHRTAQLRKKEKGLEKMDKDSLIAFYREKSDSFSAEREGWLNELQKCQVSQEEMQKLRAEIQTRVKEVGDLQQSLTECNYKLFQERQKGLRLAQDNDDLRLEVTELTRKLHTLLSISPPSVQEITYFHPYPIAPNTHTTDPQQHHQQQQQQPGAQKVTHYPFGTTPPTCTPSGRVSPGATLQHGKGGPDGRKPRAAARGVEREREGGTIRVVYLPCDEAASLYERIETLQRQLKREQEVHVSSVEALKQERAIREEEYQLGTAAHRAEKEDYTQRAEQAERLLQTTTQDYLRIRGSHENLERRYREEVYQLQEHNAKLSRQLRDVAIKVHTKAEAAISKAEQQTQQRIRKYRAEEAKARGNFHRAEAELEEAQKKQTEETQHYHKRISLLKKRLAACMRENWFQLEGFRHECYNLKHFIKVADAFVRQQAATSPHTTAEPSYRSHSAGLDNLSYANVQEQFHDFQSRFARFTATLDHALAQRRRLQESMPSSRSPSAPPKPRADEGGQPEMRDDSMQTESLAEEGGQGGSLREGREGTGMGLEDGRNGE